MKSTDSSALSPFASRLTRMMALHLRTVHLPHVRQYHARTKSNSPRIKNAPKMAEPHERWILPLHLVDLSRLDSLADATKHAGWVHFLDWGNGLRGIAEIQKGDKRPVLDSLSVGPSSDEEHSVMDRFLKSGVRYKALACVAVPSLHFRALSYVDKTTNKRMIVPLSSATVPLQRGRRYSAETVQQKLKVALDFYLKSAREYRERQSQLSQLSRSSARSLGKGPPLPKP